MKKVLSFVLVLALVLSSFSMAFAATTTTGLTDIDDAANRQAIEVCYNLGIALGNPDGTYQPEKAVTRAEFAALMVRAQNIPDSALTGYTTSSFKDTSGYGWAVPYLAFCESKGILVGDGYGNVMPGRTVTANEAVTMALRTIGYTNNSAKLVGSWPSNYVTLAQTEGLYDEVAATSAVDKSNAAQIIYNLLTVGLVQVATDGTTVELGKSVTENGKTDFIATTLLTANHGAVSNDRVVTYDEDSLINTLPYVGDYATVYTDKDDDYIIAIGKVKSVELKGEFSKIATTGAISGLTIAEILESSATEFDVDDVTYTISDADDAIQLLNADEGTFTIDGSKAFTDLSGTATASEFYDETFTINAKVTGKKLLVYSIEKWLPSNHEKVSASDLTDITDGGLLGSDFATDKSDDIVLNSFELIGASSLSDIKADNIVYVYEAANDGDIRRVAVGTEVVEGVIKSYNTKNDKFVVDGVTYVNSDVAVDKVELENVSDTLKLYLDAYGDVYTFDVVSGAGSAGSYGVILDDYNPSGYGKQISMMNADGSKLTYTLTDDIAGYKTIGTASGETVLIGQLVAYGLDKNGQIDDMIYTSTAALMTGGFTTTNASIVVDQSAASGDKAYMTNNKVLTVAGKTYTVDSDVTVYTYAPDFVSGTADTFKDATDFTVSNVSKVTKGKDSDAWLNESAPMTFFVNKTGKVVAMVIDENKAEASSDDLYGVVYTATRTSNDDGDKVMNIIGVANGSDLDKLTTGTTGTKTVDDDFTTMIQLYKINTDSDGVITKLQLMTDTGAVMPSGGYGFTDAVTVETSSTGVIKDTNGISYGLSDTVNIYEVTLESGSTTTDFTIDKYKKNGNVSKGNRVWFYDVDKDTDGIDVVIVYRGSI